MTTLDIVFWILLIGLTILWTIFCFCGHLFIPKGYWYKGKHYDDDLYYQRNYWRDWEDERDYHYQYKDSYPPEK